MNLRRLLNRPSKAQQALIDADIANVLQKCDVIATAEFKEQLEAQKSHDSVCPNCHCRKENIVNKIAQVQGSGKVSGSFRLGYGDVSGSMSVDTIEVNHCNGCGNQWKKYKIIYASKTEILRVTLKYLARMLGNPEEKKYEWKMKAIEVFDDCYLETISSLAKKNSTYLFESDKELLKYKRLKYYFKSVYDKNPRNLQKI